MRGALDPFYNPHISPYLPFLAIQNTYTAILSKVEEQNVIRAHQTRALQKKPNITFVLTVKYAIITHIYRKI